MTQKPFDETYSGEAVSITAAHEAGHALVAWVSPAYGSVLGSFWVQDQDQDRVQVRSILRQPTTWYTFWELAAVAAAGIAAETITHGRFRTKSARNDLTTMRQTAAILTQNGRITPVAPWSPPAIERVPPFGSYFRDAVAPMDADLMRIFYCRAHERIMAHRAAYERLRTALIVKIELSAGEIAEALRIPKG